MTASVPPPGSPEHAAAMVALAEAHNVQIIHTDEDVTPQSIYTDSPPAPVPIVSEGVEPFLSSAQMTEAMKDSRYRNNYGYRAEVAAKVAASAARGIDLF